MSDEPDSEEHYYSGSEEDDESQESDSDDANHGLLDLEASEGSSDAESDDDEFSDDGSYAEYSFPKFMQLPPEIREMIWGAFCPDLGPEPRVFELHLHTIISPPGAVHLPTIVHGIVAGPQLESQTEPMRAVRAVHRESRALALKSAPNEISLSNGEILHYHEERDVLFFAWKEEIMLRGIALRIQELGIEAQNLAFPSNVTHEYGEDLADLMYLLPQTRRLFILDEEDELQDHEISIRDYAWTVADKVHKYSLDAEEEGEIGLLVPVNRIFCWPDLDNYRDFAEEHVMDPNETVPAWRTVNEYRHRLKNPLEDSRELNQDYLSDEEKTEAIDRLQSIEVWPMVRFNFGEGLDRFYYIETRARDFPDQMSESESSQDDILDEYESEGIDDDPIDDSTSVDDYDEMLAQNLAQQFFQPHGSSNQFDNSSEIDELPPANFSSDEEPQEPDHVTLISDSEDGSASQARVARPVRRVADSDSDGSATEAQSPRPSKRRSRAAISESEDNEEGSSDAEPVRGANRRARAIPIDSEDEDEQDGDDAPQPSRADRRRGRAVPIDSDDDDDEEGPQNPSEGKKSRRRVVQEESDEEGEDGESDSQGGGAKTKDSGSSDDEEQSSSDDEDDDPPPPKRMSLAKRLRMESKQERSQHVDRDDSEADGMNGDGYGYSDDQEDELDKSDSDMMAGAPESFEDEDGESEGGY